MTHTAGLADETKMEGPHDESALSEAWRNRGDDLCFTEPGKIWSYSNPGYWLVGLVAEKVSKEHYADAVHDRVLGPLGLKRATFRPMEAMTWPTAIGHGPEGQEKPTVIRPLADNAAGWPAGQLFISANEYARFCIAFMNGGKVDGKQALSSFVIEKLSTPHVTTPGGNRRYGYGLSIEEEDGLRWVSHGGSRTGYGSVMRMCPEKKFAVIILCNKTGASLPRVAQKASEIVLGITGPKREPRNKPLEISAAELERYAGTYSNGKTTIRLFIRDGKLMAPAGGKLENIGENRFVRTGGLVGPDTEMTFVPGQDGKMEYLCRGGRAMKRVR
jgi:CubicO group peptidase (beta-lactamase class C family)